MKNILINSIRTRASFDHCSGPVHTYRKTQKYLFVFVVQSFLAFARKRENDIKTQKSVIEHAQMVKIRGVREYGHEKMTSAFSKSSSFTIHTRNNKAAFSSFSTLESVFKFIRFQLAKTPDTCGRNPYPYTYFCVFKFIRARADGALDNIDLSPAICIASREKNINV